LAYGTSYGGGEKERKWVRPPKHVGDPKFFLMQRMRCWPRTLIGWGVVMSAKKIKHVVIVGAACFSPAGGICWVHLSLYMLGFDSEPKL